MTAKSRGAQCHSGWPAPKGALLLALASVLHRIQFQRGGSSLPFVLKAFNQVLKASRTFSSPKNGKRGRGRLGGEVLLFEQDSNDNSSFPVFVGIEQLFIPLANTAERFIMLESHAKIGREGVSVKIE